MSAVSGLPGDCLIIDTECSRMFWPQAGYTPCSGGAQVGYAICSGEGLRQAMLSNLVGKKLLDFQVGGFSGGVLVVSGAYNPKVPTL